jgi:hypothetical protein
MLNCNVAQTGKEHPGRNDRNVKVGGKNFFTIGHCQHVGQSNECFVLPERTLKQIRIT